MHLLKPTSCKCNQRTLLHDSVRRAKMWRFFNRLQLKSVLSGCKLNLALLLIQMTIYLPQMLKYTFKERDQIMSQREEHVEKLTLLKHTIILLRCTYLSSDMWWQGNKFLKSTDLSINREKGIHTVLQNSFVFLEKAIKTEKNHMVSFNPRDSLNYHISRTQMILCSGCVFHPVDLLQSTALL